MDNREVASFLGKGNGPSRTRQRMGRSETGAALLLLFVLLFLTVSVVLMETGATGMRDSGDTEAALAAAKEALIAYTVTYGDNYGDAGAGPGHFPCPDTDGNGSPNPPCAPGIIGRIPQSTHVGSRVFEFSREGMPEDTRFWYAVADPFRNNPSGVVNSDTPGQLVVDGVGDVAAVIIAPGPPLPSQKRPSNAVSDYLEGANADGDGVFSSRAGNDRVMAIHPAEFMPAVERRVAGNMRDLVRAYRHACGVYPWAVPYSHPHTASLFNAVPGVLEGFFPATRASPVNWRSGCAARLAPPPWILANRWTGLSYYAMASVEVQAGQSCARTGCLTVETSAGKKDAPAAVLVAGTALPTQVRSDPAGMEAYFELENSTPGDRGYRAWAGSAFNDVLLGIE